MKFILRGKVMQGNVFVHVILFTGDSLYMGDPCPGGSLSRGSLLRGVSVRETSLTAVWLCAGSTHCTSEHSCLKILYCCTL